MGVQDKSSQPPVMPEWMKFVIGGASGETLRRTYTLYVVEIVFAVRLLTMMCCALYISVVLPNDLLKTRMQIMGKDGKEKGLVNIAKEIINKRGVLGLYDGLSAALFRQATYTTARMGIFNTVLDWHKQSYGIAPNFGEKLGYGMLAGAIGAFVGTPAEVALIRMTADGRLPPDQRRNYNHVFNALSRIVKEEGLTNLWKGATATISRAMLVNAAQLGTYAQAREIFLPKIGEGITLHFVASMISGLVTTASSLPLDIVKTRIQNAVKGQNIGQLQVAMGVIRNEGVLALWSGFLPSYAKMGPHTVLTFLFLEQLNKLYFRLNA